MAHELCHMIALFILERNILPQNEIMIGSVFYLDEGNFSLIFHVKIFNGV